MDTIFSDVFRDAQDLRELDANPSKNYMDKWIMCNIVTRNKVLGNLTQTQVDTLTTLELADVLERQMS